MAHLRLSISFPIYGSTVPLLYFLAPRGGRGGRMGHFREKADILRRKSGKIDPNLRHAEMAGTAGK
jgi:hypothetical protein